MRTVIAPHSGNSTAGKPGERSPPRRMESSPFNTLQLPLGGLLEFEQFDEVGSFLYRSCSFAHFATLFLYHKIECGISSRRVELGSLHRMSGLRMPLPSQ